MAPFQELPNRTPSDNEQVMGPDAYGSRILQRQLNLSGEMNLLDSVSHVKTTHIACNLLMQEGDKVCLFKR